MASFLRIVEVWVPSVDRTRLEFVDGIFAGDGAFREFSQKMHFEYGEGLPGLAWSGGEPVVMDSLDDARFLRAEMSKELGLKCGIAIPLFSGDYLMSVVTLFFAYGAKPSVGAIEYWKVDNADQLKLGGGYYGSMEEFEWTSRRIRFPRGRGLPGMVRETRLPMVMGNLGQAEGFLRAAEARDVGLKVGLAIPCFCPGKRDFVVTFLSGKTVPIAHRFEIWKPLRDGSRLVLADGQTVDGPLEFTVHSRSSIARGEGVIGTAWQKGIPVVGRNIIDEPVLASGQQVSRDVTSMLALPIVENGTMTSLVAFFV